MVDKATPEQVMELARNLPLTHCVLRDAVENATPGQLGFLANLFERDNASRAESKRRRLPKQAGFPQNKTLDGYDWSMASFPSDRRREQLESLDFVDRAEDLVLYGDVGGGKTHLAIAIGVLACQRMIPVRFFTASNLVMRLRKAKNENRLDATPGYANCAWTTASPNNRSARRCACRRAASAKSNAEHGACLNLNNGPSNGSTR